MDSAEKLASMLRQCLSDYGDPYFTDRHGMAPRIREALAEYESSRAQHQAESQDAKDAARWRVALPLLPCPGTFMDRDIERPEDWVSAIDAAMEKTP